MPLSVAGGVAGLLDRRSFCFAKCWKITRLDSTVHYLTEHDVELTLSDANTYSPVGSFISSSTTKALALSDDHLSLEGVFSDDVFTRADLFAKSLRGATIVEYLVDSRVPWAGSIRSNLFFFKRLDFDETWSVECEGITSKLKARVGDVFTRDCRYDLGRNLLGVESTTDGCKVDLDSFRESGTVGTVADARRIFTVSTPAITGEDDDYWNLGELVWSTGANNNLTNVVADWDTTTNTLTLQLDMPFDIEAGDTFTLTAGCNKTTDHCVNKYDNLVNFGGFHLMPGQDKAFQAPRL